MAIHAVTGAFGFSGRHIAARLLDRGDTVVSLTNHPNRPDPFGGRVNAVPLAFDEPAALATSLAGVDVLFNTYWVRVAHGGMTHADAVRNSRVLFTAARGAGVRRIVHVSIANPSADPTLPYYRGKAEVERALTESGPSWAILRPTVLVGDEPILVNTIAWLLRRLPAFAIPGDGRYGVAPIHVDDLADLAVAAAGRADNVAWDAVGPETFTFTELVMAIRDAIGSRARVVHVPPGLALVAARALGFVLRDEILTREELQGLMANLLVSNEPPRGTRRVSEWLDDAGPWLGKAYLPEIARHYAPPSPAHARSD